MKVKKFTVFALCVAFILLALAGCGGGSATPTGSDALPESAAPEGTDGGGGSKELSIAVGENLTELDPLNQATLTGKAAIHMIYDTLIDSNHEGEYYPALAESWEVSEDGMEWTFVLRQDVTFHNGEAFDSADVVCTYQRLLDNADTLIYATQYWPMLKSVEALDQYTVKLTMNEPSSSILMGLACTFIIPDEAFAEHGETLFTEEKMPGTGPWVFEEWVDGQYLHVSKNADYWNGSSSYDDVYVRFITEPSAAVNAHVAGTVNAYINLIGVDTDLLPLYNGTEDRIDLISKNNGTFVYMGLQCDPASGAFRDINTRRALEYAIDRQQIMDNIYGGGALPNSFLTEKTIGYDSSQPNYEYDPEKAKAALAESSYAGEEIVLASNVATLKSESVLLAISEMMNAVGFNTTVSVVESATLLDMRASGDYDAFMVTWSHNFGDPFMFLNQRIMLDVHHTNLVNEQINELILESNSELDTDARAALIAEVSKLAREQSGPYYTVLEVQSTFAVDSAVTGLEIWSDGTFDFRNVGI